MALFLWRADLLASTGLFQSPLPTEPGVEPTSPLPPPPDTPVITGTAPLTVTLEPTLPPEPTEAPTEIVPTATELPTATATSAPEPTATPAPSEPTAEGRSRYADEDAGFVFEWGALIDSLALGVSYVWLCCGVFLLLLLPAFFIGLWAWSRRRRRPEE